MSDLPPPPPDTTSPPRFQAYGAAPVATQPLRRIGALARALTVLMILFIPLSLLNIVGTIQLARKANDFLDGGISARSFRDSTRLNLGSIAGYLVVPLAVITMVWMFRMAANVRALGRPGLRFGPGWAIAGWFVPPGFVYVVPWLMFRELWKASATDVSPGDPSWREARVPRLIDAWWVLYGLVPILGLISAVGIVAQFRNASDSDATLRDVARLLHQYVALNIGIALALTASAVLYLLLVRRLSQRHMQATGEV